MQLKLQEQPQSDDTGLPLGPVVGSASASAGLGRIQHATWLSDGLLLVAGIVGIDGTRWPTATVVLQGKSVPAEAEAVSYERPDGGPPNGPRGTLVLVR